jgi:hypothetical protein
VFRTKVNNILRNIKYLARQLEFTTSNIQLKITRHEKRGKREKKKKIDPYRGRRCQPKPTQN